MCDMNVSTYSFQYHSDTDTTNDELILRYPKKSCFNKTVPRPKHYVAKSILKSTGKNIALSPLSNEKKKGHVVIEVASECIGKPSISLLPSYLSKLQKSNVSSLNKPNRISHANDNRRNGRVSPNESDDESYDNCNNNSYGYHGSRNSYSYDRIDAIFREQEDEHNEEMQQHLSQDEYYDWQREQQETKQSSWV